MDLSGIPAGARTTFDLDDGSLPLANVARRSLYLDIAWKSAIRRVRKNSFRFATGWRCAAPPDRRWFDLASYVLPKKNGRRSA